MKAIKEFLSTLPARGATRARTMSPSCRIYFYPRSPRGERRTVAQTVMTGIWISIHAPREGSDPAEAGVCLCTPISIHAPREGSDTKAAA